MARPPIYDRPMTVAERKARSRDGKRAEIAAAIQFARITAREIRHDMRLQPGCLPAFRKQLDELDAALDAAEKLAITY